MKKGDFITTRMLLERGFTFYCWFAGNHVYRKVDDGKVEYVFHDFIKQEVQTTLESYE